MSYKDVKPCASCGIPQAVSSEQSESDFYKRSGIDEPTEPGHFVSECKNCMRQRNASIKHLDPLVPRTATELLALDYLRAHHIAAIPGKALRAAHVDVVAWGCVQMEVKFAHLVNKHGKAVFEFKTTPRQSQAGFRAHVVMLICEFDDARRTYHLFTADDPVFAIYGRIKTGFNWVPGRAFAAKHGETRVVMTDSMMSDAENRLELIEQARLQIAAAL